MSPATPLRIYASDWGHDGDFAAFCARVRDAGFDGVELWWPGLREHWPERRQQLAEHGLEFALVVSNFDTDVQAHRARFEAELREAVAVQPRYVNAQAGRDFWRFDDGCALLEASLRIAAESGVPVLHETHRARLLYDCRSTAAYLRALPELRLTLDISHWCTVHESWLDGWDDELALALQRSDHVHARIGHWQGPQVADPRAPEWQEAVEQHHAWWDRVVARRRAAAQPVTFLAEFGGAPYMPERPYSREPLADAWALNRHMLAQLRQRYGATPA